MDYVLRLQALDGYHSLFETAFGPRFTRVLAVHHTGRKSDNPHYHFCLTCDYKIQALRVHLKKIFNLARGNRHLSLKTWDGNTKACSYLFHDGTDPVMVRGFTPAEIEFFKSDNDIVQAKMVKAPTIVKMCVDYFSTFPQEEKVFNKRDIFTHMIQLYRSNGEWIPNRFQAQRLLTKIESDLCQTSQDERIFINNLYWEYFPQHFN